MLDFNAPRLRDGRRAHQVGDSTGYGHSGLLRGFTSLMVHLPRRDVTLR